MVGTTEGVIAKSRLSSRMRILRIWARGAAVLAGEWAHPYRVMVVDRLLPMDAGDVPTSTSVKVDVREWSALMLIGVVATAYVACGTYFVSMA